MILISLLLVGFLASSDGQTIHFSTNTTKVELGQAFLARCNYDDYVPSGHFEVDFFRDNKFLFRYQMSCEY